MGQSKPESGRENQWEPEWEPSRARERQGEGQLEPERASKSLREPVRARGSQSGSHRC